jgi:hypothetical protein
MSSESEGFSRIDIDTNESDPAYSLAGQLTGLALTCALHTDRVVAGCTAHSAVRVGSGDYNQHINDVQHQWRANHQHQ